MSVSVCVCGQCLAIYGASISWEEREAGGGPKPANGEETVHMAAHGRGQGPGPHCHARPRSSSCVALLGLMNTTRYTADDASCCLIVSKYHRT